MARRRTYRTVYRNVRRYGLRSSAGYGYRRAGGARGIAGFSLPWIAGGALGYAAPRLHPMQDMAVTALAVLPVRLPYGLQNVAKGYVFGMIARQFAPNLLGLPAATGGGNFV